MEFYAAIVQTYCYYTLSVLKIQLLFTDRKQYFSNGLGKQIFICVAGTVAHFYLKRYCT